MKRPNILLITTDERHRRTMGAYGNPVGRSLVGAAAGDEEPARGYAIVENQTNRKSHTFSFFIFSNNFQQYHCIRGRWNGPFHMLPFRVLESRPSR